MRSTRAWAIAPQLCTTSLRRRTGTQARSGERGRSSTRRATFGRRGIGMRVRRTPRGSVSRPSPATTSRSTVGGEALEQPRAHELHATASGVDGVRDVGDAQSAHSIAGRRRGAPGWRHVGGACRHRQRGRGLRVVLGHRHVEVAEEEPDEPAHRVEVAVRPLEERGHEQAEAEDRDDVAADDRRAVARLDRVPREARSTSRARGRRRRSPCCRGRTRCRPCASARSGWPRWSRSRCRGPSGCLKACRMPILVARMWPGHEDELGPNGFLMPVVRWLLGRPAAPPPPPPPKWPPRKISARTAPTPPASTP